MNNEKQRVIQECKNNYVRLLPDIGETKLMEALEACYYDGITSNELTKISYRYLYPVNEPSLY